MTIYDRVDSILAPLFTKYYHGMQDFGPDAEPNTYAVYTVTHRPAHYMSGRKTADSYFVALGIFTPACAPDTYDAVEAAFTTAGFAFSGAQEVSAAGGYPQKVYYSMDFTINLDTED